MKIASLRERNFFASADSVGRVLDTLSSQDDKLWPCENWPPMVLDAAMGPGASGGHAFVRYKVEEYKPGGRVVFRFDGTGLTAGFDGRHYFEVVSRNRHVILRHTIDADGDFKTWLKWKLLIEPLHDALLEDALDKAERNLHGRVSKPARWSLRVKMLRQIAAKKRRREELAARHTVQVQ